MIKFFSELKLEICLYINIFILQIMLNTEKKKIFMLHFFESEAQNFSSYMFGYLLSVFLMRAKERGGRISNSICI